jgi:hypothetical protein
MIHPLSSSKPLLHLLTIESTGRHANVLLRLECLVCKYKCMAEMTIVSTRTAYLCSQSQSALYSDLHIIHVLHCIHSYVPAEQVLLLLTVIIVIEIAIKTLQLCSLASSLSHHQRCAKLASEMRRLWDQQLVSRIEYIFLFDSHLFTNLFLCSIGENSRMLRALTGSSSIFIG